MAQPRLRRRAAAGVLTLAVGATGLVAGPAPARAAHGADAASLTSSNGTTSIYGGNRGESIATVDDHTVTDAAWSPDGSRAVFLHNLSVYTTRPGSDIVPRESTFIAGGPAGSQLAEPKWLGDGARIIWAMKLPGQPWRVEQASSSGSVAAAGPLMQDDGYHYLNPDTNDSQRVVVQRQADDGNGNLTGTPEVGYLDNRRYTRIVTDAADPAFSPDGTRVAFVRGGQIWTSDLSGGNQVQLTDGATAKNNPDWSPSGNWIAYHTEDGIFMSSVPEGTSGEPVRAQGLRGVPAYRPARRDRVARLAGTDRYATATAVSQSHWATARDSADPRAKASAVVLTRSDLFADALGGSALAVMKQGPLLMTPPTALQPTVAAELTRVLAPGGMVYLLGSAGALSATVEQQVKALGYYTDRLAGPDRFATSVAIARATQLYPDKVFVATGMNFPDALAAGATAGSLNRADVLGSGVVVLTNDGKLPAATRAYLDGLTGYSDIVAVGQQAFTATEGYNRAAAYGSDRYETAGSLAYQFFAGNTYAGIATGTNWPDALAGGALMGTLNGPLLLTPGTATSLGFSAKWHADRGSGSIHTGLVFGSSAVVRDEQARGLGADLSGPGGYGLSLNPHDVR